MPWWRLTWRKISLDITCGEYDLNIFKLFLENYNLWKTSITRIIVSICFGQWHVMTTLCLFFFGTPIEHPNVPQAKDMGVSTSTALTEVISFCTRHWHWTGVSVSPIFWSPILFCCLNGKKTRSGEPLHFSSLWPDLWSRVASSTAFSQLSGSHLRSVAEENLLF